HLSDSGFPYDLPVPLRTADNRRYVTASGSPWLVYRYLIGRDAPVSRSDEDARQVGVLVACFARTMQTMTMDPWARQFPLQLFDRHVSEAILRERVTVSGTGRAGGLLRTLADHADALLDVHETIDPATIRAVERLPQTTVYNDWHRYNRLARGRRITGIIDFDSVMAGPRIVDYQNALTHVLIEGGGPDP